MAILLRRLFLLACCAVVARAGLPLMGDQGQAAVTNHHGYRLMSDADQEDAARRPSPITGCEFDNKLYGLSETWHPTLDPQEGPQYCIVCHCYPFLDKLRGLQARVVCRNIQSECPVMGFCEIPRDMNGQCCKLCPGQDFNPEMALYRLAGLERRGPSPIGGRLSGGRMTAVGSFGNNDASQSDGGKGNPATSDSVGRKQADQSAMKTDHTVTHLDQPQEPVLAADEKLSADAHTRPPAHGEYHLMALLTGVSDVTNSLTTTVARGHFSLVDGCLNYCITYEGISEPRLLRIVERVGKVLYEKNARVTDREQNKVCGSWYHVSTQMEGLLQQGQLYVVMTTADEKDGIGGPITTLPATQETFSAILRPEHRDGSGAVAMVAVDIARNDLTITMRYTPDYLLKESGSSVTVVLRRGRRKYASIQATVDHNNQELNGVWHKMTKRVGRLLPRGGVTLQLLTSSGNYRGSLKPTTTCDTLSSVLSAEGITTGIQGAAGSSQFRILPGGFLHYQVSLRDVGTTMPHVTLVRRQRNRARVVCDLEEPALTDSSGKLKTNGTCGRLNTRQTHWLLHGDLEVKVTSQGHHDVILAGHVRRQRYNGHVQQDTEPILLSGGFFIPPVSTAIAAHAWIHVDHRCRLHYDVRVSESHDRGSLAGRIHYDEETLLLEPFYGESSRGAVSDLPESFFDDLDMGRVQIRIVSPTQQHGIVGAKVQLSSHCSSSEPSRDDDMNGYLDDQQMEVQRLHLGEEKVTTCHHGNLVHEDGDTWVPLHEDMSKCRTCFCKAGETLCHETICPVLECDNPISIPGECCPQCPEKLSPGKFCYFDGDKRNHTRGSTWHPYVPPFGYMPCATCQCEDSSDNVTCSRSVCPDLDCDVTDRIRLNDEDCCQVCREGAPKLSTRLLSDGVPQDPDVPAGGCLFHGSVYTDGESWHPRVPPFGEIYCIDCTCQDGESQCTRETCPVLTCTETKKLPQTCCPVCQDD